MDKLAYERKHFERGVKYVAGVDEVGRGPLCGPGVASAVILPKDCQILYLNDSKKLSEKKKTSGNGKTSNIKPRLNG